METVFYQNRSLQITAVVMIMAAAMSAGLVIISAGPDWSQISIINSRLIEFAGLEALIATPGMFGLYLFFRFSRYVTLTDREVIVHQFRRKSSVRCSEVIAVLETDKRVPANLVLITANQKLRIPRNIERFFEFYKMLRSQTPALRQLEQVNTPWRLQVKGIRLLVNTSIFVFAGGFFVLPIVLGLNDENATISLALAALVVSPLVVLYFLWFRIDEPVAVSFEDTEIEVHFLFWRSKARLVSQLRQVQFISERKRHDSVVYTTTRIVLRFANEEKVTIGTDRAWAFGYSPERLYFTLKHLYDKQAVCKEWS